MNANEERTQVKSAYRSDSWSKKVDKMTDNQVHAIYIRFIQDRVIKGA